MLPALLVWSYHYVHVLGSEKVQELLNVLIQSAVDFPDPSVSHMILAIP